MTRDELNTIIAQHKGLVSAPVAVNPTIDNPDPAGKINTPKISNPNPDYRYVFNDGTDFTLRASPTSDPNSTTGFDTNDLQVVDPGTALKPPTTRPPTSLGRMVRIDAQGSVIPDSDTTTPAVKLVDPNNASTTIDLPNPKAGAQPNGKFTNIVDPRDPAGKRIIGFVDTGDNSYHALPAEPDPATGRQIVNTGTKILAVDKDNKVSELATIDKQSPFQAVTIDGKAYRFDPNESDISKSLQPMGDQTPGPIRDAQNNPMVWDKDQGKYTYAPGVTPASTVSTNTTSPFLIWYDAQGNEVKRVTNPNYQPTPPTQLQADVTAPNIPLLKPDGTVQWVPNQNRVPAGQAMQDLLGQVGVRVNGNQMSMADAKDMLTGAVNTMNAQTSRINAQTSQQQAETAQQQNVTTAAGDILANTRGNAQTGAGLLQQRVQAATGALNSILGQAAGARNLMSAPAGLGEQLVGGLQGWTADLMGGQRTLDSAARLVQAADPRSDMADPTTHTAIGVLSQMLDKYQQVTGTPHPAVAATQAAGQSAANGGMTAPATVNPQQLLNQQAAGAQTAAATQQFGGGPFGAIGTNPMLAAQQAANRQAASNQTAAATQQFGGGFGAIGSNPMQQAFVAPVTAPAPVAPPKMTVTFG
ncbi:MAG TPA: hypothetical protein VGJ60_34150 [Chloroflexota bacterium]|jgi:hypothetical protein